MSVEGTVEFEDVTVVGSSDDALCCRIEGKDVWIPKSQIHDDSEVYKPGTDGILVIPEWLAIKKGLV